MAIRKKNFKARFLKKDFARLQMSLIMVCTVLSGLILSKFILTMGLDNMLIRYPIVLMGAYLGFFIFMKLWLLYLTTPYPRKRDNLLDAVDLMQPDILQPADFITTAECGGGQFAGAGAGGSFDYGDRKP